MTPTNGDLTVTITDTPGNPITVSITLAIHGRTETFTASAETAGDPRAAASSLLFAVRDDASEWARKLPVGSAR